MGVWERLCKQRVRRSGWLRQGWSGAGAEAAPPARPPSPGWRRSHGDMELALEAHPTLQVPYLGSTTFALKA